MSYVDIAIRTCVLTSVEVLLKKLLHLPTWKKARKFVFGEINYNIKSKYKLLRSINNIAINSQKKKLTRAFLVSATLKKKRPQEFCSCFHI